MKTHQLKSGKVSITVATDHGPVSIPTPCTSKAEAQALIKACNLTAVEQAARAGVLTENLIRKLTTGGSVTVEQAFEDWKQWIEHASNSDRTSQNNIIIVKAWMKFSKTGKLRMGAVKEADIGKWINNDDGTSLGTRRVRLAGVRSFFKFCQIKEYISRDISGLVRVKAHLLSHEQKERKVRECFTADEYDRLVSFIRNCIQDLEGMKKRTDQEDKRLETLRFWNAATQIGRWSGLRLGDICTLEWSCFAKAGTLTVWTDKRDRRVEMPVGTELADALASIPSNTRKHCFPKQAEMIRDRHQRCTLSVQFTRLLEDAKVYGKSFHCLRHTLATELNSKGETIEAIAEALGHTSTKTTKGYVH